MSEELAFILKKHDETFEQFRIMCGVEKCENVQEEKQYKRKYNYFLIFVAIFVMVASCTMTYTPIILTKKEVCD